MGRFIILRLLLPYMPCFYLLSHPTVCNPMDSSLPVSSAQSTSQARILEGLALPLHRIFLDPGMKPCILHWQVGPLLLSHQESSDASRRFLFHYYGNGLPNRGRRTNFRKDSLVIYVNYLLKGLLLWTSVESEKHSKDTSYIRTLESFHERLCLLTVT